MMYVRYVTLVLVGIVADLLNFILAPIAVLFASEDGWLPRWLWWLQTPDNPLDGDGGWQREHRPFPVEDTKAKRWWNRTRWIYRNSMYGFAIYALGVTVHPGDRIEVVGNMDVSNRPLTEGLVKRYLIRNGVRVAFQWYYVKAWSKTRCIRINLGWKLWGDPLHCQLTFSPNPLMGYTLKNTAQG